MAWTFRVLLRSFGLLLQHPIGLLWTMLLSAAVIVFSLGILAGPMQVGLFRVLVGYTRDGTWQPAQLWGNTTRNNLYGGVVFLAVQIVALWIGVPLQGVPAEWVLLIGFVVSVVLRLLWFYTFQILSDRDQPWTLAIRNGWHLMRAGNLGSHIFLIAVLNFLALLPTDTVGPLVQFLVLLIITGFSTLAQAVAYVLLVPTKLEGAALGSSA